MPQVKVTGMVDINSKISLLPESYRKFGTGNKNAGITNY